VERLPVSVKGILVLLAYLVSVMSLGTGESEHGRCPACGCVGPNPGYTALTPEHVRVALADISPHWTLVTTHDKESKDAAVPAYLRRLVPADRSSSLVLVNRMSIVAEREDVSHHPDIHLTDRGIEVRLTTHSAGGLTEYDFRLARALDEVFHDHGDAKA
jgi:pterin-4a-carbinolamine dehydratase